MKKNILLAFGGDTVESDISILTAQQAFHYIDKDVYNIIPCYIHAKELNTYKHNRWQESQFFVNYHKGRKALYLSDGGCRMGKWGKWIDIECALICTHGGSGENGGLQGMLELYDIPYTSCGVFASSMCMDKWLSHQYFESMGIPVVDTTLLTNKSDIDNRALLDKYGSVIVKPATLGSSIGVAPAKTVQELKNAIDNAFVYDSKVLVQQRINNLIEYNCAALKKGDDIVISTIERPITAKEVLDFESKYIADGTMNGCSREYPAKIDKELEAKIKDITCTVYQSLEMYGSVRIDYLYDSVEKELYLNEVNTVPGSLAYYLFENNGLDGNLVVQAMISCGVERAKERRRYINKYQSNVLNSQGGAKGTKLGKGNKI